MHIILQYLHIFHHAYFTNNFSIIYKLSSLFNFLC